MPRFLVGWLVVSVLGSLWVHAATRIDAAAPPAPDAQRWAMAALEAARRGEPLPVEPESARTYRAQAPVVVHAWWRGRVRARHRGDLSLLHSVRGAARQFAADSDLVALPGWRESRGPRVAFTVTVPLGEAPLVRFIPVLSSLGLVPIVEGVAATLDGQRAELVPDEITAAGAFDSAVRTPIPDLSFGVDLDALVAQLAAQLGVDASTLAARGRVVRFRAHTITAHPYPARRAVTAESLEQAAREGAQFLLRHQARNGRFTYIYDARRNLGRPGPGYSMPRHGGATYFLAQAARTLHVPGAREGALRALDWVRRNALSECGAPGLSCVRGSGGRVEVGSSALVALAAAEVLRDAADAPTAELLVGLTAHLRAMQRPDGELMHEYDLARDRPIDVQRMYYSGEAAFALLNAHSALRDPRDLQTVKRLMRHLTGEAWSFFGGRYYYGEEHWTCQAAATAADRMDARDALRFCLRWADWQRALQYGPGQTPWPVAGAYGVGPLIVPRFTAVASRVEAGVHVYEAARALGLPVTGLREQIEAALGLLLAMRWAPGPEHLFFDPRAAQGGFPATQVGLEVRNDFVQHAGSAMLHWAGYLRRESP